MAERKRKLKFSDSKLQVLFDKEQRHCSKLQARTLNMTERNCIWDSAGRDTPYKCASVTTNSMKMLIISL